MCNHDHDDWGRLLGQEYKTVQHIQPLWERRAAEQARARRRARYKFIATAAFCWAVIIAALWWRFK